MNHFLKKVKTYATLSEMTSFWIFLPIVLVLLNITFLNLPAKLAYLSTGLFFLLLIILFVNNLRLARSHLEIKVERNELSSIINNLRDGIIAYDTDFKVLVFNKAAEGIFDLSAPSIIGTVFSPDSSKSSRSVLLAQTMFPSLAPMATMRSEPGAPIQVVDLSFDEPKLELRVSSVKIMDPANKLLGFLKIVNDRTREIEILKSKSEFITVAAHQLRTPLSAIAWTLETLLTDQGLSAQSREFATNGRKASEKVLKIVNDLLDVSKIEEGRFGYKFENIEIVGFMENILAEAATFAAKYGIGIYFEKPEPAAIPLVADPSRLSMAVNNIIDNAIKYNVKNGQVRIKLEALDKSPYVQISISDTGVGISKENIDNMFKKFFRGDNVVRIETEGSGLGMYIAKNIILRHGGAIRVESELNRGTTFYFTLPTDPSLIRAKETVVEE